MTEQFGYPEQSAPHPEGESGEALRELIARYWALLKRFYWILILTAVAGGAAAYVWTEQQPRIYEATSKLLFHETQPNVLGSQFEEVDFVDPGGRFQFEQFWNTQREVLNSKWFAERVVDREGLADDPRLFDDQAVASMSEDELRDRAVATVRGSTSYSLQRDSRVANVDVQVEDPELAAQIANGVAESYRDYLEETQAGGMENLSEWFDDYVSTQRQELDQAHRELQEYQQDHNILSLSFEDRKEMTSEALDSISARLRDVEAELYEQEALLNQIVEMEQNDEGDLRALADLVDNEGLSESLSREAELERERARLTSRYLEDHPEVREVDQQLETVRDSIDGEIDRIRTSVENQVAVTNRNVEQLEAERERLTDEIAELNDIGLEYNQLADSADTMRQHYEAVLERTTELDLNALYDHDIIQILERAETPGGPVSPQLPLNLAIGLLAGLLLGGGVIVFIDALDNTIKSHEQIEQFTDKPVLGTLPKVEQSTLKGVPVHGDSALDTLAATAPRSSFSEAIKTLRTNVMFMAPDEPPEVILMTSPGPGEGKTLSSLNMAIALAQSGEETIVVDSDMRRPRIHKALGIDDEPGMSQILTEDLDLDDAIAESPVEEGPDVLTCGPVPPNPSELLHTERFRDLVDRLRNRYDRVVFDSPPMAAVADALILSHSVDAVLLILRFGQTRQDTLSRSVEQLEAIGAPLLGAVLNDIDESSGYSYAYYYRYRYDEPEDVDFDDADRMAG